MRKLNKPIYLTIPIPAEDLTDSLDAENSYEDLIRLILAIDAAQQDWEFTRMLKKAVDGIFDRVEEGGRVNDKNV